MYNKIDWISFSFYRELDGRGDVLQERRNLENALFGLLVGMEDKIIDLPSCEPYGGRAPYLQRLHNGDTRANLFWHPLLSHALVELGGQACDWLEKEGLMMDLLHRVQHRVTRIDLARDIPTSLTQSFSLATGILTASALTVSLSARAA